MINKTNVKKESTRSSINNKWTKTLYRYYLHSNANLFATVLNAFSKEIMSMNIKCRMKTNFEVHMRHLKIGEMKLTVKFYSCLHTEL